MSTSSYSYLTRVAIGIDQLCNAIFGGDPDETISARLYRHRRLPWWRVGHCIVNALFFWQWRPELGWHCQQAWQSEMDRSQLGWSYRRDRTRGVKA